MSKYSFLLPAYKPSFLDEALARIVSQTFEDFTVIVSDDYSPDDIESIVKRYKDSRISYRRNPANIGAENLVDHWNLLLESSDAEYVIIASDDDIYSSKFLEEIDELAVKYPDADILMARANTIDNSEQQISAGDDKQAEFLSFKEFIDNLLDTRKVHCVGNYVFKRNALKEIGGFVKFPLAWKSDTATAIALASHGVPCTSGTLFSFRLSGESITSMPRGTEKYDRLKLLATEQFFDVIKGIKSQISPQNTVFFKRRLCGEMQSYYWTLGFSEFLGLYWRMITRNRFASIRNAASFIVNWFVAKKR